MQKGIIAQQVRDQSHQQNNHGGSILMKKPKVKIKSNREEIVAINEKAKEQRLSYGQLVALQYLEERSQNEKNI